MGYKALQHLDNADWLVGFTEGDGSFSVSITKYQIRVIFCITQNHLDKSLLLAIKDWFNCGHLYPSRKDNTINYTVQKRSDITNIIVPFFEKHPLRTVKKQKVRYAHPGISPVFWTYSILENLYLLLIEMNDNKYGEINIHREAQVPGLPNAASHTGVRAPGQWLKI